VRTGNFYWNTYQMIYNSWYGGRMIGALVGGLGMGAAFYFAGSPSTDGFCTHFFTGNGKNNHQASVRLHPDGSLSVHQGKDGTQFGISAPGVVVWGAYSYIEALCICDAVNGEMEVRVNNATVLAVSGVNTDPVGSGGIDGMMTGTRNNVTSFATLCQAISDYVIWDTTGGRNNTFMGDVRCRTTYPALNGGDQDWAANGEPSAFDCINHVPADTATRNISAANVGDVSSFGLTSIPTNTSTVFGAVMFSNANKSDAGVCEITPGIDSNNNVATGTPFNPGTGSAYYVSIFEVNPDGGGNLDYLVINNLLVREERTA
jgi:hypothetical protein